MPEHKTFTQSYRLINVHAVNGEIDGIEFLRNADSHLVEGLFFFARHYGRATFEYRDRQYELLKNRNLTYTVRRIRTDEEALAEALR